MKKPKIFFLLCVTVIQIWFDVRPVSCVLPLDQLLRGAADIYSSIKQNVQKKMQDGRQQTGAETVNAVREAIVEDYQQNGLRRRQKICEYLKQGNLYRGPCPEQNQSPAVQPPNGYDHDKVDDSAYEEEDDEVILRDPRHGRNRYDKQQRRLEKKLRREERRRQRLERKRNRGVVEEEKIVIKVIDRGDGGGGGGRRQQPVIVDYDDDPGTYQVPPERIVEDEYPRPRPPPPNRGGPKKSERQNRDPNEMTPCQTNNGHNGICMPASYCYAQYANPEEYRSSICERLDVGGGLNGICCPTEGDRVQERDTSIRRPQAQKPTMNVGFISLEDINVAAKDAHKFIENYIRQERELINHGMFQRHGSMQSLHQAFFGEFDPVQFRLTIGGFINLVTTIVIKRKFKLNNEQARDGLHRYSIEHTDLEKYCIPEPSCRQGKYRTIDGSCNNLQRPLWGKSNTAFERLLPPHYDDGLHEPRTKSSDGSPLPSSRWVSYHSAQNRNQPDPKYTLMLMQWGQFIDHDLTLASSTRASTGQGLICCHPQTQKKVEHHACFPIDIPQNDPFYSRHNQRCMHFVRNSPAPRSGCSLGHREQMNTLSQVLDASMVYGSSQERAKELRLFRGGKLKTSNIRGSIFMPFDRSNSSDDCVIQNPQQFKCFLAGDGRVNEQTGLTMIHNLLVREHNRVCDELSRLNPDWSDTILFQEARRIVAAEIQHITYNEWLPIVIGSQVMKQFRILPKAFGFTYDYDPRVNPNIINEFATAAYRFHSLVQGKFRLLDNQGRPTETITLHEIFNNPISMYLPNAFDQYLNGFTTDPAQSWDKFFTDSLTNHLFEERGSGFGMDLVALNIQRGRDHGLPGYNHYRALCGLRSARSFQELDSFMEPGASQIFSQLYKNVDDIDLFIGGVHERPLPGALVGPVFACIIAEQFHRTKLGDRFWYENGKLPHSFSEKQLFEIRKTSLASIICQNGDSLTNVQPLVFLRPGGWNSKVSCGQIAKMRLDPWQGERIWS